jgi:plastocyanin
VNATCTATECDATINSPADVVNSGFIANDPIFEKPNVFKAKFMTAGTYPYICALHGQPGPGDDGMIGTIVVLP